MKISLPDEVYSLQDLKVIILDIRRYAKWYSQYAIKLHVTTVRPNDSLVISKNAADLINSYSSGRALDQSFLDELITSLDSMAATLPRMTITVAAPPPDSLKKTLINWLRQNIHPNMLVEFHFKSALLGGMVVKFGSHVYDWSFRRQILAAQDKFPEVLRHVR